MKMMVNQGVKVSTENRKGAQRGERMRGLRENFALLFFLTVLTRPDVCGAKQRVKQLFSGIKTPKIGDIIEQLVRNLRIVRQS